jgi:hypothetical protein
VGRQHAAVRRVELQQLPDPARRAGDPERARRIERGTLCPRRDGEAARGMALVQRLGAVQGRLRHGEDPPLGVGVPATDPEMAAVPRQERTAQRRRQGPGPLGLDQPAGRQGAGEVEAPDEARVGDPEFPFAAHRDATGMGEGRRQVELATDGARRRVDGPDAGGAAADLGIGRAVGADQHRAVGSQRDPLGHIAVVEARRPEAPVDRVRIGDRRRLPVGVRGCRARDRLGGGRQGADKQQRRRDPPHAIVARPLLRTTTSRSGTRARNQTVSPVRHISVRTVSPG